MNYLKNQLQDRLDQKNLNDQITYYLYSQILVRSGGIIYNEEEGILFNPFLDVAANSNVVVYSSGSFGQHILSTNTKTNFFNVREWIDIDYHPLSIGGNSVKPISAISNCDFDALIIATINPTNHDAIEQELRLFGIDHDKIVKLNTDINEIRKLLLQLGFDDDFNFEL
jgi:hypothetical protein